MESTPKTIDVESLVPDAVSNDKLVEIAALANKQYLLEKEIEDQEEATRLKKLELKELSQTTIPTAMAAVGLSELKSKDGKFKLTIKPFYSAKIDETNVVMCHDWLMKNHHGAIIKHNVVLNFDKDSVAEVTKLKEVLEKEGYTYVDEEKVHPTTLVAFVKEQVEAGAAFPLETFKGHVGSKAVIKKG